MQGKRTERVAELLRMELSSAILTRVKDPRLGFVTVTRVEMSNDLQYAKVFYSVLGDKTKRQESVTALERARGFLQRDVAQALNLRYTPHLQFHLDESSDHVMEIEGLIKKIQNNSPESA